MYITDHLWLANESINNILFYSLIIHIYTPHSACSLHARFVFCQRENKNRRVKHSSNVTMSIFVNRVETGLYLLWFAQGRGCAWMARFMIESLQKMIVSVGPNELDK